jgi:lipoprotein-releasing system ATP-binding protein
MNNNMNNTQKINDSLTENSKSVSVKNLFKTYRDVDINLEIIKDLNFDFVSKSSTAIVGRSGIGKSTLLHILGGLDTPTSGSVKLDGVEITGLSQDELSEVRAAKIGFVFQFHHLLTDFTALENVALPLIVSGISHSEAKVRAIKWLTSVGMENRANHLPNQLSGGEQQRVAIARAVVTEPTLFLADEPTGNLDFQTAADISRLLVKVQRETGSTMIVVTHSQDLARQMDYVLEMGNFGKIENYSFKPS